MTARTKRDRCKCGVCDRVVVLLVGNSVAAHVDRRHPDRGECLGSYGPPRYVYPAGSS